MNPVYLQRFCIVVVLGAMFFSCNNGPTVAEQFNDNESYPELNEDTLIHYVQKRLSSQDDLFPCSRNFRWLDLLRIHYSISEYQSLLVMRWTTSSWDTLLALLEESESQGLDRRYYAHREIKDCLDSLQRIPKGAIPYALMADLELWGAHALVSIWHDIQWGRIDPVKLYGKYYHIPYQQASPEELLAIFLENNPIEKIRQSFLADSESKAMSHLLDSLRRMQMQKGEPDKIDFAGINRIDPGKKFEAFSAIARRMLLMGWIDSASFVLGDSNFYPVSFKPVMIDFQRSLALSDDGVVGGNTMEALNYTLTDYINDIRANFERKRWVRHLLDRPMIWVNIPDYRLQLYYPDSTKNMKICVGKARSYKYDLLLRQYASGQIKSKPSNHETPQVYSKVNHMVINPTWTVPLSIVKNEMLDKMRRDPGYLSRNHYQVINRKGEVISPYSVNWTSANVGAYTIRQTPGQHNALGQIKFMFANPFSVYMHDTPNQAAFGYSSRDVSHGCVRLEKPLDMAQFLCANNPGTLYDDLRIMLGYAPLDPERLKKFDPNDSTARIRPTSETKVIHLKNPVPVLFDYRTIFMDDKGSLKRRFDTYRKQRLLMEALQEV